MDEDKQISFTSIDDSKPPKTAEQAIKDLERKKQLTKKQRDWLKYYIETGNKTLSASKAYGYDLSDATGYHTAAQVGFENWKKLEIDNLMEEMGLSDAFLMKVLASGIVNPVRDNNKPDYSTRHKYLETALKVKKRLTNNPEASNNNFFGDISFQFADSEKDDSPIIEGEIDSNS